MEMWIKTYWPIAWAVLSTLGMLVLALLSKTYAKRDDLAKVEKKVDELKAHVDSLPTQKQITDLLIALERTNGRMESLEAKIQPVQHLAQLLLEQRLKDDK
jgi:predicted  nucleic acid-binding Zn-ribbon protein